MTARSLKNGCSPALVKANTATLVREGVPRADAEALAFDVARSTCGHWLFSYGSNSGEQLSERLGRRVKPRASYVVGYRRVFRGKSQRWGGGVASLKKNAAGTTYGALTEVRAGDLEKLDVFEGVASGKYRRIDVWAYVKEGGEWKPVVATAYVSTSDTYGQPTRAYLEAVAKTVGEFWSGDEPITWRSFPLR
jgi:hypothetical protein